MTRIFLLCLVGVVAACGGNPMGERPEALPYSYEEAEAQMETGTYQATLAEGEVRSARFNTFEKDKFRLGDVVVIPGAVEITARMNHLTNTGHFTFVSDPPGIEGEVITYHMVVSLGEDGLVMRDETTGKILGVLKTEIGRSPDVARLIIAKLGDVMAAGMNGVAGIGIKAAAGAYDDNGSSGGGAIAISGSESLSQTLSNLSSEIDIGSGCPTGNCGGSGKGYYQ
ncbi:MAG: hypothetical protein AAGA35_03795 [Patescibacteria group bacterium]